jgi:hypothetical protein
MKARNLVKTYDSVGVQVPQFFLPKKGIDLSKWAVVACDQYTSQPEYWEKVNKLVGTSPSTLRLMLPEIFLGKKEEPKMVKDVQAKMREYLEQGVLVPSEGLVYVERMCDGRLRKGLIVALDLERYDYNKGAETLVRATEGTIVERLPPRIKIREGALIELPHIMVLIDDPGKTVIEPLGKSKAKLEKLYDFELMMNGGHLTGFLVKDESRVIAGLEKLADPVIFKKKYGLKEGRKVLLFAMGDGNHSLATAKAIWENKKRAALASGDRDAIMSHPSRFALVELVNVHDEGLEFEPIHRVLFKLNKDFVKSLKEQYGQRLSMISCSGADEMKRKVDSQKSGGKQLIGLITKEGYSIIEISGPETNLPVGTIQIFLDRFIKDSGAKSIDYVHGFDVVSGLGSEDSNLGIYLPAMNKGELFKTVILDGALPRKTFSMGEANEKRFYMECRKISE